MIVSLIQILLTILKNDFSKKSSTLYLFCTPLINLNDYLLPTNVKFLSYDDLKRLAQHFKLDNELRIITYAINMYQQKNKTML